MRKILRMIQEQDRAWEYQCYISGIQSLHEWDDEHWMQVLKILATDPTLTSLSFMFMGLEKLSSKRWEQLCNVLSVHKTLKRLDLSHIELNTFSLTKLQQLCCALAANRSLISLDLSWNGLCDLDEMSWTMICMAIGSNRGLDRLKFWNNFGKLKAQSLNIFLGAINFNPSLRNLDLGGCYLSELDISRFKLLCDFIANNRRITSLYLGANGLGTLDVERLKLLCDALKTNQVVTDLYLGHNELLYIMREKDRKPKTLEDDSYLMIREQAAVRWKLWCDMIARKPLKTLSLQNNFEGLGGRDYTPLAEAIGANPTLMEVDLSGNYFTEAHHRILQDKLKPKIHLRHLAAAHSLSKKLASPDLVKLILNFYGKPEKLNVQVMQEVIKHDEGRQKGVKHGNTIGDVTKAKVQDKKSKIRRIG